MNKKRFISIEERLKSANDVWDKIKKEIESGIIDREKIILAITMVNTATYIALKEGKRNLL